MIKVNPTYTQASVAKSQKSRKVSKGGANFSLDDAEGAEEASASTSSQAAGAGKVDSFLALQEISQDDLAARQAKSHGEKMLEHLNQIRLGILTGKIPKATLEALVDSCEQRKNLTTDPRLGSILDDIELRAKVELAKIEMSQKK